MGNNLKALRVKHGLTQPELAERMGTTKNQLIKLEKGDRRLSDVWIARASEALGEPEGAFLGEAPSHTVPVLGYVGAGSEIYPFDDHEIGASLEEVEVDFAVDPSTVAVIVRGSSMLPVFEDGDLVGYGRDERPPGDLVGKVCVVKLADDRMFIKRIRRGSHPTLFTLVSSNAEDIEDVEVLWARPFRFRIPSDAWRRG